MDALRPAGFPVDFNWDQWVGVPYATAGNCWEFIRLVLRDGLGAELPPFFEDAVALRAEAGTRTEWHLIGLDAARPFDVLVFWMSDRRPPHVGVVVGVGTFIHCIKGGESGVDSYHRKFWRERIREVYHYRA